MTQTTVTGHDGRLYHRTDSPTGRTVFVHDMPMRSDARAQANIGFAQIVGWLDPVDPAGEPMALVRPASGGILQVAAHRVAPDDNVARRRILPRPHATLRFA